MSIQYVRPNIEKVEKTPWKQTWQGKYFRKEHCHYGPPAPPKLFFKNLCWLLFFVIIFSTWSVQYVMNRFCVMRYCEFIANPLPI